MAVHDDGRQPGPDFGHRSGPLPDDLRALLTQIVDAHAGSEHEGALRCCLAAVDFAREDGGPGSGALARRAAALLLDLECSTLPVDVRRELAVACGLTALGAMVRSRAAD